MKITPVAGEWKLTISCIAFEVSAIVNNSLPLVYLAVAQAVIVIAGGLDLGVGGLMVLVNTTAARFMLDQPFEMTILIAVLIMVGAAVLNGFVGWVINTSGVPDIVITLGTLFIYQGMALAILAEIVAVSHGRGLKRGTAEPR